MSFLTMTCEDVRKLLDAYFDAELDAASALSIDRHLESCQACAAELANLQALRAELTPEVFRRIAPAQLAALRRSIGPRTLRVWPLMAAVAAGVIITFGILGFQADPNRELVDNHVRSLMANHLVDVPSSDRHTVKPWFQGKVDFAPEVPDLPGYEIVGGRLDILNGAPCAAIVYRRGGHFLNVSIRKSPLGATLRVTSLDGYQIATWSSGGLQRAVVTDMNAADLRAFVDLLRQTR